MSSLPIETPLRLPLVAESLLMQQVRLLIVEAFPCHCCVVLSPSLQSSVFSLQSPRETLSTVDPVMVKEFPLKRPNEVAKRDLPGVCVCKYDYFERKIRIMM